MRSFNRRAMYAIAAVAVLLGTVMPALASADQVTQRSIALSSSSASATNVTYTVNFTAAKTAGAFVLDFCSDSPVIGQSCAAPAGFNASTATTATSGFSIGSLTTPANNKVLVTGTMASSANISVDLAAIANPTTAGPLYARIVTYANSTDAAGYTSTTPDATGTHVDDGGVAISITPTIGVSGAVLETMTFCVSGSTIGASCDPTGYTAPTLKLGQDTGGVIALNSSDVYTGTIHTQISTNAANGAVINLKSSAHGCGGLINSSKPTDCYILPALKTDIVAGQAKFGVKLGADDIDATNGTIEAFPASGYNATTFALNYVNADASGVTSNYGDPILDTNSKPANNKNMPLTFGASVSNNTPAGSYSADLSLIATGKF